MKTEYDIGKGWVGSIGYQGNNSRELPRTVPYQLFVVPNPSFGTVNMMLTDVNSNFNALLLRATWRFAGGYSLNAEYRFSKSLDTCSNNANCVQTYPFDQSTERGPSGFDVTHMFHGPRHLASCRSSATGTPARHARGGLQVSGIFTASSGSRGRRSSGERFATWPWRPAASVRSVPSPIRETCRPRRRATKRCNSSSDSSPGDRSKRLHAAALAGTFTEPPRPGVGRNSFRGPRDFNGDMTVSKMFRLPTMAVLQDNGAARYSPNAFNLFNNLNLTPFNFNSPSNAASRMPTLAVRQPR